MNSNGAALEDLSQLPLLEAPRGTCIYPDDEEHAGLEPFPASCSNRISLHMPTRPIKFNVRPSYLVIGAYMD